MQWIEDVKARAVIADVPAKANEQHYEVCPGQRLTTVRAWLNKSRFQPSLCCRLWVLMPNTHHVSTRLEMKPWQKQKNVCSKVTAGKLS